MYMLEKAMDASALRQRTIAHNIANINTPRYKRYEVSFEDKLNRALETKSGLSLFRTNPYHLPRSNYYLEPEVIRDNRSSMRNDGNNVDIDREMAELAQNSLNFNFSTQQLNTRLAMIRYVINDGRR
ncbi:MAG: flagellar basal-body rod protein FlgB [Clostridia bacterium]|nr:flagellar basal-body rod protein FlgB [Clostridia bacterium]